MKTFATLRDAARDSRLVDGLTHSFYRYPARFSPTFASTAIRLFSKPGDLVLDPFMGGGTSVLEAFVAGRRAFGSDINSLSLFIAKVKTTPLAPASVRNVVCWARDVAQSMNFRYPVNRLDGILNDERTTNLSLPNARPIKKAVAVAMSNLGQLAGRREQDFARCLILKTSQWALDNRARTTSIGEFRERFVLDAELMATGIGEFSRLFRKLNLKLSDRTLSQGDAAALASHSNFVSGERADLVVTSPPYPGIHMLYHRWQVDGRRESPAPYWITDTHDGQGASHYTFASRRCDNLDKYFERVVETMSAVRKCLRRGGHLVQMVAFSQPEGHLKRYLEAMTIAGYTEVKETYHRIRREVPNRKWHATFKGKTASSKEVVLVHKAS